MLNFFKGIKKQLGFVYETMFNKKLETYVVKTSVDAHNIYIHKKISSNGLIYYIIETHAASMTIYNRMSTEELSYLKATLNLLLPDELESGVN